MLWIGRIASWLYVVIPTERSDEESLILYRNLNLPGAPPYACDKVLRVPVPGFHRAQGFAVFERSRSFFACVERKSGNRR
jgi:hypothetical protein